MIAELEHLLAQPPSPETWAAICKALGSLADSELEPAVALAREPLKCWRPELRTIAADSPWLRGVFDAVFDPRLELAGRATIQHEQKYSYDGSLVRVDLMDIVELFARRLDPAFDPPNVVLEEEDNIRYASGCGGGAAWKYRGNARHWLAHDTRATEHSADMETWEEWTPHGVADGRSIVIKRHDYGSGTYELSATGDLPAVLSLAPVWKAVLRGASVDEARALLDSIRPPWSASRGG